MRQLPESNKLNSLYNQGLKVSWGMNILGAPSNLIQIYKHVFPRDKVWMSPALLMLQETGHLWLIDKTFIRKQEKQLEYLVASDSFRLTMKLLVE